MLNFWGVKDAQLSQFFLRPQSRGAQKAHWDIGYNHGSSTQRKWDKNGSDDSDVLMARGGVIFVNTRKKTNITMNWVVVSNIFVCSSLFGEMIQFDYIIFFKWVETTN